MRCDATFVRCCRRLTSICYMCADVSLYEKAWEMSRHTFARAKRCWGNTLLFRKQYKECVPHLLTALELNPLFPKEWFACGYAALESGEFKVAAECFSRVVSLDPQVINAFHFTPPHRPHF
jgi:hypothetical protein